MHHFLIFPSRFFPFTNDRSRRVCVCVFYKAKSVFEICSSRQTLDSCSFWKLFQYFLSLFSVRLDLDPNLSIPDPAHVSHRFHCVVAIDRVGYPDVGSLWPSGAPTSSSSSPPPLLLLLLHAVTLPHSPQYESAVQRLQQTLSIMLSFITM